MQLDDSLVNLVTGLGTDRSKVEHGKYRFRWFTKYELEASYHNDWLAGKLVDTPCDDMTREWRAWKGGPRQRKAMLSTERKLRVRHLVNTAMKMARLYGGSAILIGDGDSDPSKELDYDRIHKNGLKYLHALSRWEIWAAVINRDPLSKWFGEPSYYSLVTPGSLMGPGWKEDPAPGQGAVMIHPSRVIRFQGQAHLETTTTWDGWGLSVLQRAFDPVRNVAAAAANMATMTYETKLDVIKIPNLTQNVMSVDYREKLLRRLALANQSKSVNNALLLDSAEEWEQKTIGFSNFPEVLRLFLEMAAGAADIPLTRLLGTSSKGMNATGESDIRNYYDMLAAKQETELRPALERLDVAMARTAGIGGEPDFDWNPLWQLRENERSTIALQTAQRDQIYATMGMCAPSALRSGIQSDLIAKATYPGIEEAIEKAGTEAPGPLITKAQETGAEIDVPSSRATVAKT